MDKQLKPDTKSLLLNYTGGKIREVLKAIRDDFFKGIHEIRIRADKPLIIKKSGEEWFISLNSEIKAGLSNQITTPFCPNFRDIAETVEIMSRYSLYAFEDELRNGFITIPGGNRIGICGQAVTENGKIKILKNISALNIRITHEVKGCANYVMAHLVKPVPQHTLIISPPCKGKTTLLRDIVRQASDGNGLNCDGSYGYTIGLADERGEIAACYGGIPQNDVGIRTDVLDLCPKAEGMLILLRSMSPQIIAADEIGKKEDIYAIEDILNAGVKIFCTVHGFGIEDASKKPVLNELIGKKIFERYIVLKGIGKPGGIKGIFNENFERLDKNGTVS